MAQLRLAVVLVEAFLAEDEFAVWFGVARLAIGFVEAVDDERSIDFDGLVALGVEEGEAAAEAAGGNRVAAILDRLAPGGHHLGRRLGLVLLAQRPCGLFEVQ
ncbi:MAG: hypothetical protein JW809_19885 [Pirellulales bacterium]|nr:hypothetical protein [Pirellulales bacterium]